MPKILLDITDRMEDHVTAFRNHYKIAKRAQALRMLILAGFAYYGNPLKEDYKLPVGKPGHKAPVEDSSKHLKEQEETNDRYEELMQQLGLISEDEDPEKVD